VKKVETYIKGDVLHENKTTAMPHSRDFSRTFWVEQQKKKVSSGCGIYMQDSTQQALISISQPLKLHEPSHHTAADNTVDWLIIPIKHWECAPFFLRHRHHQTITTVQRSLPIKKPVLSTRQYPNGPSVDPLVATSSLFVHIPAALAVVSSLQCPCYTCLLLPLGRSPPPNLALLSSCCVSGCIEFANYISNSLHTWCFIIICLNASG
jgi:hypothetical protein